MITNMILLLAILL